ncbi:MAG TPA: hypothetical protein VGQ65_04210 [Thermoanaerobaculia bacterium]|jgi:hypothetical protein|nr:hypothetical protein [Thermoanaerobaculia bacterium]
MTTGEEMRKWIAIRERLRRTVTFDIDNYNVTIVVDANSANRMSLMVIDGR